MCTVSVSILIVLAILSAAVILFVTERIRSDLVALLVLLSLMLTGLLSSEQALAGFANPVIITIASVLVLSGSLARTGVASAIGRQVLQLSGRSEGRLIAVMMSTVGLLSGIMNDIGVTALMMPVVIDIARRTERPPSKLLIPLAFGSLLGGMTTLIGTTPNILISGALQERGLEPFAMFDFTPVGLAVLAAGIGYMLLLGRRLLPDRQRREERQDLEGLYELDSVLFTLSTPSDSPLMGRTLAESHLGSALGLNVLAIERDGRTLRAPPPNVVLSSGDRLIVEGRLSQLESLRGWKHFLREPAEPALFDLSGDSTELAEAELKESSTWVGQSLAEVRLRQRFGVNVLALRRGGNTHLDNLPKIRLRAGDVLLLLGRPERIMPLAKRKGLRRLEVLSGQDAERLYDLPRHLLQVRLPDDSLLAGKRLEETRLGDAFSLTVLGIRRAEERIPFPEPDEELQGGDVLLLEGNPHDLDLLDALQELSVDLAARRALEDLESEDIGMAEVMLTPRSTLAGCTPRELDFRERYGLTVVAIWRGDRAYRSNLRDRRLRAGDAFVVYGPRRRLAMLAPDPDFLVLEGGEKELRKEKMLTASLIMVGVLASVIAELLPIYLAAPLGASLMVLTRCITLDEAYRSIELKAIVLVGGMLSMGAAMEQTGAARLIAESVLGSVAAYGPSAVLTGLFFVTALSAQIMPTAAVAVLVTPIALSSAQDLGLSPYALSMIVALGSSSAFLSPVGHPVNLLVMSIGGYRYFDYTKVGLPLLLTVFVVVLLVLPLVWPLTAP